MDPVLQELLIGLASNGLSELIGRGLDGKSSPVSEDAVKEAVGNAVAQLTDVEEILPSLGGEEMREFLLSAEAHNVVRQIFASTASKQIDEIEREFQELWRVRMDGLVDVTSEDLARLFRSLVQLCEGSLDRALKAGNLTALEAKAARRHGELRGALASLERALAVLDSGPDVAEIDDYAAKYCRQLAAREGSITPPALDSARQVPIDSLYVPARLEEIDAPSLSTVSYERFARTLFRRVVLGNPGSGKSTLAKKLAADIARNRLTLGHRPQGMVPFLVVLRDFGARKREDPCSIVEFIASTSNSRYQVPAPPAAVEYLLLTNRAMVIFDGLDELLDTSYRTEISGDVESFATLYPSVPLLVTSREVGYAEAPLSPEVFTAFRLGSFSDDQAMQYAQNWFAVEDRGLPDKAAQQAATFMDDSESVSDLRSNALMLGLMCNLYKGAGYIPRNRPDVYEACAKMLFDRWDRLRQIGKPLNIESLLRPAMQYLAAWIYADGELQSGVTERQLVATASEYLLNRRFESIEDAELEARRFIEFCRGRAWVFTDIGTTASGERLYQFTHRTFLEFFTAEHLVRANPSPEKLLAELEPRISVREWDVVAQLAFQLLDHNVDGAADTLLSSLVDDLGDLDDPAEANRMNFAARGLEFLVPSPAVTRSVVEKAIARLMKIRVTQTEKGEVRVSASAHQQAQTVVALLGANPENASPICDAFVAEIGHYLADPMAAVDAAELSLNLDVHLGFRERSRVNLARPIGEKAIETHGERLREIGRSDAEIGSDLVLEGTLEPSQCLADHGLAPMFADRPYRLFPGPRRIPVSEIVLGSLLGDALEVLEPEAALEILSGFAPHLNLAEISELTPAGDWRSNWLQTFLHHEYISGDRSLHMSMADLNADQRYALIVTAAIVLEGFITRRGSSLGRARPSAHDDALQVTPWAAIIPVLAGRSPNGDTAAAIARLNELELSEAQRDLILKWIHGEISLGPTPRSDPDA